MSGAAIAGSILGGLDIGEGIFGASEARAQAKLRMQALQLRMKQIEDSTRQTSIQQMQKLNTTLADQAAIQAAGGGGTAGLVSGNMIRMTDINQFAQDENADKLNEVFQKEAVESGMMATSRGEEASEISSIGGGLIQAGSDMANAYIKSPASDPTPKSVVPAGSLDTAVKAPNQLLTSSVTMDQNITGLGLQPISMPEI